MKDYEDIFGAQVDNASNGEVENNNVENTMEPVETVFPNYSEAVEPVAPVGLEPEITDVNNVFGENVMETEEVANPTIPDYSDNVETVMLAEENKETVESTEVNNVFEQNTMKTEPVIPVYGENVEPVAPVEEVVIEEQNDNNEENANNYNPMEHPDAKIVLNKNVEETKEVDPELESMKIAQELKSNSSLKFVIILGILLLIVIFALPYLSELLG